MAMNISGIKASLRVAEGKDIPVYQAEKINSGTIAGFVASEAGESFEVCIDNGLVSGEGLVCTVYIDGREMQRISSHPFGRSVVKGVYGPDGVRPFTFSTLQLKEDDGEAPSFDISKLGVIEVQVCRALVTTDKLRPATYKNQNVKARLDPISEKAKKVGWHSVSLGAVKPVAPCRRNNVTYVDQLNKPYAIFRFRYKPRELLEDEGIAPRTERPKQPSTGEKRPRPEEEADMGPSAKRPATDDVKPEPTKGSVGDSQAKIPKVEGAKKVKRERVAGEVVDLTNRGRSPIRVPVKGEVIDLSDD
ncbi:hypothetical protein PENSPDRAFT_687626 [Peniophora sp. CONT]|nr:hypothetical protein PENSPDRAFT_687626 [Peniophora sp. CONT]